MYEFVLRSMKGFGFGLLIGPIAVAVIAAYQAFSHNQILAQTREVRATIRNAHIFAPKGADAATIRAQASYKLDLDWYDPQGLERRAENVAIHPQLGRRLVDGGALVRDTVRIRVSTDEPSRILMIEPAPDDSARRDLVIEALLATRFTWPLAMFGGLMFYLAIKRERRRDGALRNPIETPNSAI